MKKIYQEDVKKFYTAFTGKKDVPETIKSFNDINTFDFNTLDICDSGKKIKYKFKKNGFTEYGDHLKKMLQDTKQNQEKLVDILNKMFQYTILHAETKNPIKKLVIHPELNIETLKQLTNTAREIIIKIFLDCENNYKVGIQIFGAIIRKVKFETEVHIIENLELLKRTIMEQKEKTDPDQTLIESGVVKPVDAVNYKKEKEEKENIEKKEKKIAEELGADVKSTSDTKAIPSDIPTATYDYKYDSKSDSQPEFLGKPPSDKIQLDIRKAPPSEQNTDLKGGSKSKATCCKGIKLKKFIEKKQKIYKDILKKTERVMKKLNIPFFLSSGTLLGYYREGKIMDHDYDIDIGIFKKDYNSRIFDEMKKEGLFNYRNLGNLKNGYEMSFRVENFTQAYENIDIFVHNKETIKGKKYFYWASYEKPNYLKRIKYRVSAFDLKPVTFLGVKTFIPNNTEKYLLEHYGKNWKIPMKAVHLGGKYHYSTSPKSIVK